MAPRQERLGHGGCPMTLTADDWTLIEPVVEQVAKTAARRGRVDTEDMEQELRLWVIRHTNKVRGWLPDETAVLAQALQNAGRDYAQVERERAGYVQPGPFKWQLDNVAALVREVFRNYSPTHELPDTTAGKALRQLDGKQWNVLFYVYGEGLSQRQVAERIGVSQQTVSEYVRRALTELYGLLCPVATEPVGTRRVVTNNCANAITSDDYNGRRL